MHLIRDAVAADIPALLELGALMHQESIYASYDFDRAKVEGLMLALINSRYGILFVSEEDGVIHGGFMGAISPHWFGNDMVASDCALFLAPEHRSGRTGIRLVQHYIQQAQAKGARQITLSNSTGVQVERVAGLFERMGFFKRGYVLEYVPSV